ncbi:capsid cement protein [Nocardioides sp. T2.26MG-1]|uniref:capsid cement protein n=1 Tax=Nocardioides sp. T2.26MG-1 TaxID=3041166 RepID=UPI0024779F96|nr:capsid cement protein [Nocardioides sp. T2.26MG-1]CAI9417340.1 hypothetical protein HIDPHFAB_02995 [Nocardioides sp. T2.26MG-1]
MAKNCILAPTEPARVLPVPAGTVSGGPVLVGGFVGVAAADRADAATKKGAVGCPDGYAPVEVTGLWELKVPEAVTAAGTPIYIVAADNTLTTTATGNTLFGHTEPIIQRGVAVGATKAVDSGGVEGTVYVRPVKV